VTALFKNVPVLDSGARGSTTTFVQRGIGDVFLSWENEAFLAVKEFGADKFEIVVPSLSILGRAAGHPRRQGGRQARHPQGGEAYLEYLYSPEGQEIAAKHFYRPRLGGGREEVREAVPQVNLFTIDEVFGGWQKAQAHFNDGGVFDKIISLGNNQGRLSGRRNVAPTST
jgi:sulfate/thiosulfate transport system substrate-binding protein